jgi:phage tail-like protein
VSQGDFRQFVFRTPAQWQGGVGFRVHPLARGGFELFSAPAFDRWITRAPEARGLTSFVVDEAGRVLWLHREDGWLYCLDPANGLVDRVIQLAEPASADERGFGRMLQTRGRIWIHDRAGGRSLAMRADTFQVIGEIGVPHAVDVTLADDRLYVLDANGVTTFDAESGRRLGGFAIPAPFVPIALGAHPGSRFVFVIDASARAFQRFTLDGRCRADIGRFDDVAPTFRPQLLCVDAEGHLFASDGGARVHQFAADGGYVGDTGALGPIAAVSSLAAGADGGLYVADRDGLARFGREGGAAGRAGEFYSATLDSGSEKELWHRVDVHADIDAGGALDVYYATSDDPARAERVAAILAETTGAADRATAIDRLMTGTPGGGWRGPYQLRAVNGVNRPAARSFADPPTHSVLLNRATGRYLWLKIVVSARGPRARAAVRELRVHHPRQSWLRYLPAIYQEDEAGRELLERYLAIFETVLDGIETTIGRTAELIDPGRTPPELLDWLAQWLDLAVEEEWPETVKRRLIARAADLYARKGTPAGLADFIEIVTGTRPLIRESFEQAAPYVVGATAGLGVGSRISTPPTAERPRHEFTRLGDGASLGRTPLQRDSRLPIDAFAAAAHRFTVVLSLPGRQYRRLARGLERVIREQTPAHAAFDVRVGDGAGLGGAVVGVNWRVVDPQPLRLGESRLGRSICRRQFSYGPELGADATLRERSEGGCDRAAICAGE